MQSSLPGWPLSNKGAAECSFNHKSLKFSWNPLKWIFTVQVKLLCTGFSTGVISVWVLITKNVCATSHAAHARPVDDVGRVRGLIWPTLKCLHCKRKQTNHRTVADKSFLPDLIGKKLNSSFSVLLVGLLETGKLFVQRPVLLRRLWGLASHSQRWCSCYLGKSPW